MMKKQRFIEKKSFRFFKSFLYKNGEAQIIPVVAGRLVCIPMSYAYSQISMESVYFENFSTVLKISPKMELFVFKSYRETAKICEYLVFLFVCPPNQIYCSPCNIG